MNTYYVKFHLHMKYIIVFFFKLFTLKNCLIITIYYLVGNVCQFIKTNLSVVKYTKMPRWSVGYTVK